LHSSVLKINRSIALQVGFVTSSDPLSILPLSGGKKSPLSTGLKSVGMTVLVKISTDQRQRNRVQLRMYLPPMKVNSLQKNLTSSGSDSTMHMKSKRGTLLTLTPTLKVSMQNTCKLVNNCTLIINIVYVITVNSF